MTCVLVLWGGVCDAEEPRTYEGRDVAHWADELASISVDARRKAVYALFQLGPLARPHVRDLAKALRDTDDYVRTTANRVLLQWSFDKVPFTLPAALPDLIEAASDDRDEVRRDAIHLIYLAGPIPNVQGGPAPPAALVSTLARALSDPIPKVRANAAAALGNVAQHAKPALEQLAAVASDEDETVRRYAVQVMAWVDGAFSLPHAMKALGDAAPKVRVAALGAIGAAPTPWPATALAAVRKALRDHDETVRRGAVDAIWSANEAAGVEPLIETLTRDKLLSVRGRAAVALGGLGDPRAIPTLVRALDDEADTVRSAAANALGSMGPEGAQALPQLMAVARADAASAVRQSAVMAIGSLGPWAEAAIPTAIRALDEADRAAAPFLASAVSVLARHHQDLRLLGAGIRALGRTGEHATHEYALQIVGAFGSGAIAALPELRALLRDPTYTNRNGLHQTIGDLGAAASPLVPLLRVEMRADGLEGQSAAYAVARVATNPHDVRAAVARLVDGVDDEPRVRNMALYFLLRLGPRAAPAVSSLRSVFDTHTANLSAQVGRLYAAGALVRIGGADRARALKLLGSNIDPKLASARYSVLVTCGATARGATDVLLRVTNDLSATQRYRALEALGKIGAHGPAVRATYALARKDRNASIRRQGALGLRRLDALSAAGPQRHDGSVPR